MKQNNRFKTKNVRKGREGKTNKKVTCLRHWEAEVGQFQSEEPLQFCKGIKRKETTTHVGDYINRTK